MVRFLYFRYLLVPRDILRTTPGSETMFMKCIREWPSMFSHCLSSARIASTLFTLSLADCDLSVLESLVREQAGKRDIRRERKGRDSLSTNTHRRLNT